MGRGLPAFARREENHKEPSVRLGMFATSVISIGLKRTLLIKPCPDQGERERKLLTNSRAQTKAIANASTY
jgi:hypothetical protein